LDNVRPAHQRQKMPLIEAIKLQSSSGYPCSEASITFISKRHNGSVPFLRPTALAVLRLRTISYLVGAWMGSSCGFAPRNMRSTYHAA
jgi:hypothetical protein